MTADASVIDPIDRIEWRDASTLNANLWNPNVVFTPELRLLEYSLLEQGWIQPILINRTGLIIDGFHRWRLAQDSPRVRERWGGRVPCAVLDLPDHKAMLLTVRINRAKGTHVATRMSQLVRSLLNDFGVDPQQLAVELGATIEEVELLAQPDIFKARNLKDYKYSRAWYPAEEAR